MYRMRERAEILDGAFGFGVGTRLTRRWLTSGQEDLDPVAWRPPAYCSPAAESLSTFEDEIQFWVDKSKHSTSEGPLGKDLAIPGWTHGLSSLRIVVPAAAPIVTHAIP